MSTLYRLMEHSHYINTTEHVIVCFWINNPSGTIQLENDGGARPGR